MNRQETGTNTVVLAIAAAVGLGCGICFLVLPKTELAKSILDRPAVNAELPSLSDVPRTTTLSVSTAYSAIPHRRTTFVPKQLDCEPNERAYLRVIFATIDQAVAARVSAHRDFAAGKRSDKHIAAYERLHNFASQIAPPKPLRSYHAAVLSSLDSQRKFFVDWQRQADGFDASGVNRHRQVRKASSKLIHAYNQLMKKYPQADKRNRDAFFDYHCALDFI